MPPLISCNNLTIGFEDRVLYRDLSFDINSGDYLFVIGENGAGKTTLMKTLLGLKKLLGGEIKVSSGLKLSDIGYLPQQTVVQRDFPASVFEIVISGFAGKSGFKPFYSADQKKLAVENMNKLGIADLKNKCYRELSGGQQQRVLLARTLCAASKVLLLDEPVAGLDPYVTEEFYELIRKLNEEGITIIMISHDIPAAKKYASHVLHITDEPTFMTKRQYFSEGYGAGFAILKDNGN